MVSDNLPIPRARGGDSRSAKVVLRLLINGETLRLAQIGTDMLIFDIPVRLREGPAEVIMHVDGRERRWAVQIGASDGEAPTRVVSMSIE